MTNIRLYALLAALLLGGWKMQAQELEPTEILPSPTIIAYHLCNWDDETILLNGAVLGDGLYVMKIDEEGHLLDSAVWFHSTNTCSFLTESKFFRLSDGSLCFYYVKGPDRPVVSKVSISENLDLTVLSSLTLSRSQKEFQPTDGGILNGCPMTMAVCSFQAPISMAAKAFM